ncbi:SCP2 sterol-binding domain-containing protein [Mesobacillus harenae]|uniref:SCP2 sterol-binding domain-containing protein n=1 Tax=Mesobacillus harenae TaxID=2213203 RepID=UPI00157FCB6B|nr:SCP2 sterol-binding domain-containing protein [Mesobacillus harenae]
MPTKEALLGLVDKIKADPSGIEGINSTYQFDVSGKEEASYQLKFENGQIEFSEDDQFESQCTLKLSSENFLKLASGNLNPQLAFMMGQIKVEGDLLLAMKLTPVLKSVRG